MTLIERTLATIDEAATQLGLRLVPLPDARLALFGPRASGPAFNLVLVPDEEGTTTFRVRPVVAHPPSARPLLDDVIEGWHSTRRWPRLRVVEVAHEGDPALLVEGDVELTGVDTMPVESLTAVLAAIVESARDFWDTCPLVPRDPFEIGEQMADDLGKMLGAFDECRAAATDPMTAEGSAGRATPATHVPWGRGSGPGQ